MHRTERLGKTFNGGWSQNLVTSRSSYNCSRNYRKRDRSRAFRSGRHGGANSVASRERIYLYGCTSRDSGGLSGATSRQRQTTYRSSLRDSCGHRPTSLRRLPQLQVTPAGVTIQVLTRCCHSYCYRTPTFQTGCHLRNQYRRSRARYLSPHSHSSHRLPTGHCCASGPA